MRIIVLIILPISVWGQENLHLRVNGFADTYHAMRSSSPNDWLSSRSRLRTELQASRGKSWLFASLNATHNNLLSDQTKLELREAFFQYTSNNWDVKAGRQIVTWGVADGVQLTDVVSPMDYSEFLARDYDDIRIPVDALSVKYGWPNFNLELIVVPVPSFFVLPVNPQNPWSMQASVQMPMVFDLTQTPEKKAGNSEFGARMCGYFQGIDVAFSVLRTWNKMPVIQQQLSALGDTLLAVGHHGQMTLTGLEVSAPVAQFVVRVEAVAYFDELQATSLAMPATKNSYSGLLGLDWYPGGDWTLMAQYYNKYIADFQDDLIGDKTTHMGTLRIGKKLLRSTLDLSSFTYFDLGNGSFFSRTSADYALSDQIHLMAGYDWFHGDDGKFAMYKDNSEYWFKAKFSF